MNQAERVRVAAVRNEIDELAASLTPADRVAFLQEVVEAARDLLELAMADAYGDT